MTRRGSPCVTLSEAKGLCRGAQHGGLAALSVTRRGTLTPALSVGEGEGEVAAVGRSYKYTTDRVSLER